MRQASALSCAHNVQARALFQDQLAVRARSSVDAIVAGRAHSTGNPDAVQLFGVVDRCVFNMNERSTISRDTRGGSVSEQPLRDLR
jgi:hypothetical protein